MLDELEEGAAPLNQLEAEGRPLHLLDVTEFSKALARACSGGSLPEEVFTEAARRAAQGLLRRCDQRYLLLECPDVQVARQAREAAWQVLSADPRHAMAVLQATSQLVGGELEWWISTSHDWAVQAGWRTVSGVAHGAAVSSPDQVAARGLAVVSLVGHLSAMAPVPQEPRDPAQWGSGTSATPEHAVPRQASSPDADSICGPAPERMSAGVFRSHLHLLLGQSAVEPAMVAQVAARAEAGLLDQQDLYRVLLDAAGGQWEPARQAALQVIAGKVGLAVQILGTHSAATEVPKAMFEVTEADPATDTDLPTFYAEASYPATTGTLTATAGPYATAKLARHAAAFTIVADLAGLQQDTDLAAMLLGTDPGKAADSPQNLRGKNSLLVLHELRAAQVITGLEFLVRSATLQPSGTQGYTCRASCTFDKQRFIVDKQGRDEKGARHSAAQALHTKITASGKPLTSPAPRVPAQANAPAAETTTAAGTAATDPLLRLNTLRQTSVITKFACTYTKSGPPHQTIFTCSVSCRAKDSTGQQALQATGTAPAKRDAYRAAAAALIRQLTTTTAGTGGTGAAAHRASDPAGATTQTEQPIPRPGSGGPESDEQAENAQVQGPAVTLEGGVPAVADPATAVAAVRLLRTVLADGAAVTFHLPASASGASTGNLQMLVYTAGDRPLPDQALPVPLARGSADLVVPGVGVGVKVEERRVWHAPLRVLAAALAHVDEQALHPSARTWKSVAGIALEMVSQARVRPATDADGRDVWRAGPLTPAQRAATAGAADTMPAWAHCAPAALAPHRLWDPRLAVRCVLDAITDAFVRGPGAAAVLGAGPWTTPRPRRQPLALSGWADQVCRPAGHEQAPALAVTIKPPPKSTTGAIRDLEVTLRIATAGVGGLIRTVDAAHLLREGGDPQLLEQVRWRLRNGARAWPPLTRLLDQNRPHQCSVTPMEAALLLGDMGQQLKRAGIEVQWPQRWGQALESRTVVGTRSARTGTGPHGLGLTNVVDFRWQLTVDGAALTDDEMDQVAAAEQALVFLREQWLLVGADNARRAAHRTLPPLPASEALAAALTGTVALDGAEYPCEPVDALADLVAFLRTGAHQSVPVPGRLNAVLRDYQIAGLSWLANTTRLGFGACLADDMGTGKTVTALAVHLHRRETMTVTDPTLVICPASLLGTWDREIGKFAPGTPVRRYHGPDRTLDGLTADTIVVTTYGTMRRDIDTLAGTSFDLVIADEAQYAKNHLSGTARALRRLTSDGRVAMTGTPVENTLMEAWSILDWANPGLLGTARTFSQRHVRPVDAAPDSGHARRLSRILSPFMLRRRKTDPNILQDLPPKIVTRRFASLTSEQIELYDQVARATLAHITATTGIQRRGLVLQLLTRLRQICNAPAQFLHETPQPALYDPEREGARSGKLAAFDDLTQKIVEAGESALVFTSYAAMGRLLVAHLQARQITPLFLHGRIPPGAARQKLVDAFQHHRHPIMILTVKAAGTGLTLTRAQHVIMYDRPWNPAVEEQAIDRAHRIGQHQPLQVHLLHTEHTIEDRIDALLHHKRALAEAVLHSGLTAIGDLSDDELADLITLGARR